MRPIRGGDSSYLLEILLQCYKHVCVELKLIYNSTFRLNSTVRLHWFIKTYSTDFISIFPQAFWNKEEIHTVVISFQQNVQIYKLLKCCSES